MFDGLLIIATPFAIIGVTAYYITIALIRHRERMAGLQSGSEADANDAAKQRTRSAD